MLFWFCCCLVLLGLHRNHRFRRWRLSSRRRARLAQPSWPLQLSQQLLCRLSPWRLVALALSLLSFLASAALAASLSAFAFALVALALSLAQPSWHLRLSQQLPCRLLPWRLVALALSLAQPSWHLRLSQQLPCRLLPWPLVALALSLLSLLAFAALTAFLVSFRLGGILPCALAQPSWHLRLSLLARLVSNALVLASWAALACCACCACFASADLLACSAFAFVQLVLSLAQPSWPLTLSQQLPYQLSPWRLLRLRRACSAFLAFAALAAAPVGFHGGLLRLRSRLLSLPGLCSSRSSFCRLSPWQLVAFALCLLSLLASAALQQLPCRLSPWRLLRLLRAAPQISWLRQPFAFVQLVLSLAQPSWPLTLSR